LTDFCDQNSLQLFDLTRFPLEQNRSSDKKSRQMAQLREARVFIEYALPDPANVGHLPAGLEFGPAARYCAPASWSIKG